MVSAWPTARDAERARGLSVEPRSRAVERLIELIGGIRNARHEAGIAPAQWLGATIATSDQTFIETARVMRPAIQRLARLRPIEVSTALPPDAGGDGAFEVVSGDVQARMTGEATVGPEDRRRLERELDGARSALARAEERLANRAFTERAPADVVSGARSRADELRQRVAALEERIR
jgi:valyl-tRNA synthetase